MALSKIRAHAPGTNERLFAVRATSADEIRERLAADPWSRMDLLRVSRIVPWTLRIGSLPERG